REKEDKASHQRDVEPLDATRPISSSASSELIPPLDRCQSVEWGRSRSVKNLKNVFESPAQQSAATKSAVIVIPLTLSTEAGDDTKDRKGSTPRPQTSNSADRIRISPSIQSRGVGVEAVLKARADKVKTDSEGVEVAKAKAVSRVTYAPDEVVRDNPLFAPDAVVRDSISYLLSEMAQGKDFNCERAAEELSVCILRFPIKRQFLIDTLIQLRETLEEPKRTARFDRVLILVLERGGNEPFLVQFFTHIKADLRQFASQAASRLSEHQFFPKVEKILSRIIRRELRFQKRDTLFRQPGLSSSLFRDLGAIFCSKELTTLKESIEKELINTDPSLLPLDYNTVKEALESKDASFKSLNQSAQEPLIQKELSENAKRFCSFASPLLSQIYDMKISPVFSQLLAMRRRRIINFLKKQQLEANTDLVVLSRPYISEVIYLRFLVPQIVSIGDSKLLESLGREVQCMAKKVLVSLGRVVQCMAKVDPKDDPLYKMLGPLFIEFTPQHCQFIDRIT
ncbi:MAG TPA: hypothetical protein VMR37_08550, partial [Rhabdochlamydiaceae bacterium]|nr:hypothetical protein [Rhabdochlamydiaceae bacterium]